MAKLRRDAFVVDVGGNMNPRGLVARTHLDSPLGPILLAFGCAFATGLVFGYMPARKAARVDPIVALGT